MTLPGEPRPGPRRPLVGLACLFVLGIWAGLAVPIPAGLALAVAWGLWIAAVFFGRTPWGTPWLAVGALACGCACAAVRVRALSPRALERLLGPGARYVELVGLVADDAQPRLEAEGRAEWYFEARVEAVRHGAGWQRARGTLVVQARRSAEARRYEYGQRWIWQGLLTERLWRRAPGARRLVLQVEPHQERFLSGGHGWPWLAWCYRARQTCTRTLAVGLENFPHQAGLLQALLLGYRQELPASLHDLFSATGTLHVFAISGLHVGVVAALAIASFTSAGLSRPYWGLALAPVLVFYTMATGMRPSAVRAGLMACLYEFAPLVGRRPDPATALAVAATLILAAAPEQLADPGFLLSFVVVAGLLALYPPLAALARGRLRRDPWQLQRETGPARALRRLAHWSGGLAAASLAAWLVSAPLTAFFFNVFSPIALLGNLLVIPIAFLVVLTGCLALLFGSLTQLAAEVFNHANRVFISALLGALRSLMSVPGAYRSVPAPPACALMAWYAALALLVFARRRTRVVGALLLASAAVALAAPLWRREVYVDILAVGPGDAALVRLPGPRFVMVDAGPDFQAENVRRHLKRQGVAALEALILTHADADHVGGAQAVLETFPVRIVACPKHLARSALHRGLLEAAARRGALVRYLQRGDRGVWAGGVEWEVLHPGAGDRSRCAGDLSLVLRLARGGASVLFMGGAGGEVEQRLLEEAIEPSACVLVAGDHGTCGTCSEEWLDAVAPREVVISVGRSNRRGDPDPDVLRRLAARGLRVWSTAREGTLRLRFAPERGGGPGRPWVRITPG